mgnify:CR=1 FL=1
MLPGILVLPTLAYPPGTLIDTQTFDSAGSGTWSKTGISGGSYVTVEIWGAGGGGGSAFNGDTFGQGGQGGYYKLYQVDFLSLDATEAVVVGAGGVRRLWWHRRHRWRLFTFCRGCLG